MFYIYLIESVNGGELYIGSTDNLKRRLEEHNQGLNFSTKRYKPWKYVYIEGCLEKTDAARREKYLKSTQGRRMLRKRLKDYFLKKSRKN